MVIINYIFSLNEPCIQFRYELANLKVIKLIWFRVPLMGCPAFSFIGQGKTRVTVEGKEETEKEKKSSRIAGSFFFFTRVPPTL